MKPQTIGLVIGLALVGRDAAALTQNVTYTSTAIQVTGSMSQFSSAMKLFDLSGQSSDNTASFYAAWDQQALYIGVDVKDTALYCNTLQADSEVAWSNDSVELNFDLKRKKTLTTGDTDFRQWIFPIVYNNNAFDAYGSGSYADTSFSGTATVGFKLTGTVNDATADTGYTVIIRIPWADLSLTPTQGLAFGFDAAVNDRDSVSGATTYMDWAKLTVFAQPDKWNELQLTGGPPPTPDGQAGQSDGTSGTRDSRVGGGDGGRDGSSRPRATDVTGCQCDLRGQGRGPAPYTLPYVGLVLGLVVLIGLRLRRR